MGVFKNTFSGKHYPSLSRAIWEDTLVRNPTIINNLNQYNYIKVIEQFKVSGEGISVTAVSVDAKG